MARGKYARATDFFIAGEVIQPDPDGPLYWVQKLNTPEKDETRMDASARRARVVLALKNGADEVAALKDAVTRFPKDRLIVGILAGRYSKYAAQAGAAIQADPAWQEKLDMVTRVSDLAKLPEAERTVIGDINADYMGEFARRVQEAEDKDQADLEDGDVEEIQRLYVETFIDERGNTIFSDEMRFGEILFGVRECEAVRVEGGDWDHTACSHLPVYDDIDEVRALPDELVTVFTSVFNRINVAASQVKGSVSRPASSGPSRQHDEEEASTRSTQEVSSPEPVGTSA